LTAPEPAHQSAQAVAQMSAAFAAPLDGGRIAAIAGVADVETVLRTGSTNTDLLGRFRAQAPVRPLLLAALEQTQGRGRSGGAWHTAPGSALLFSLAIPLTGPRSIDGAVSLACGLAAAEALAPLAAIQLQWPNDLLLDGRKLGGVLCELALDGAGQRTLIAGIGINLWLAPEERVAIAQPAAALDERVTQEQLVTQRDGLIGRIAAATCTVVTELDAHGFSALRARFLARFALLGREVEVLEAKRPIAAGVAVDIDAAGRLLLRTETGTRAFAGGAVSLRIAARPA